ncbi:hypothetical protein DFO67_1243 [Modicisalibacter xianhensis]|uniref:Uncharacterized protein n=1 Tax=Modicisalibacter xianhensis TaxID=442341 RepID=A0A4R8FD30_9GAMM|nr:hypothetical protein [Halomonas xianhensis]TDX23686.1 hypothetical protein DFO67_1243 [Halomonas xianhensis]
MTLRSMARYDQDLRDWDLILWTLLHQYASEAPHLAASAFNITEASAHTIARMPRSMLEKLASGTVSSFRPVIAEEEALELMQAPLSPMELLSGIESTSTFDARYWMLLSKSALSSPASAAMRYGVSIPVAEMTRHCSSTQLMRLASELQAPFTLRFPTSVLDVLGDDIHGALTQKMAYCLQN